MSNLFMYKTDADRVSACHDHHKQKTLIHGRISGIIETHRHVQEAKTARQPELLGMDDILIIDHLLNWLVVDIEHQKADAEYIERVFNGLTKPKQ